MTDNQKPAGKTYNFCFAAIDPYIERVIPSPKERVLAGRNMVEWGDNNSFPNYLLSLSQEAPTLRSVILGTADFICGNGITLPFGSPAAPGSIEYGVFAKLDQMNLKGDTIFSQVRDIAVDWLTYGGFALQVIRSKSGAVIEVYYCDIRHLRSNKENTVFYYSEKWGKAGSRDAIVYPAFIPLSAKKWATLTPEEQERHAASILYVKSSHTQVYPLPPYCAALKACETERAIADYHLNAINNNFVASQLVNFNNGTPPAEMQEEIETNINEKFAGHKNAGRIMVSFNPDRAHAVSIEQPKVEDFGSHYNSLEKSVRQQIFTSFRANPNLFGIPTENLGFSSEEYESAFRLYNRTVVKPIQTIITDAYDYIFGQAGFLNITPFSLDEGAEKNVR